MEADTLTFEYVETADGGFLWTLPDGDPVFTSASTSLDLSDHGWWLTAKALLRGSSQDNLLVASINNSSFDVLELSRPPMSFDDVKEWAERIITEWRESGYTGFISPTKADE